jgi:very-short-patch-repair endonuclease
MKRKQTQQLRRSSSRHINWNNVLLDQIRLTKLPEPQLEYQFHANRRWRFDFCWKQQLVACEVEGGIWMQTDKGYSKGHAHPERFEKDCEKYNEAALYGWLIIRVTPRMIGDGRALDWLERALLNP